MVSASAHRRSAAAIPSVLSPVNVDAGDMINPALRQRRLKPLKDGNGLFGPARRSPGPQHLSLRRGQRANHGDAPDCRRERQDFRTVGHEHDRTASRLARQLAPLRCPPRLRRSRAAPIGIVEQAETLLQLEHATHARIDRGHCYEAALKRLGQALYVRAARHVDIDAGVQRERRGLDEVRGHAMVEEFRDGVVVADQDALEAERLL